MRLPTFLLIGVGRAGTTSLYAALRQHPQVFVSRVKEPRFFVFDNEPTPPEGTYERDVYEKSVTEISQYARLFEGVSDEKAWGEGSTTYLHSHRAPLHIHDRIPNVRLIAILRHPVERAYSHFALRVREGKASPESFSESLQRGLHRDKESTFWQRYLKPGFYARHLEQYLQFFSRDQMKIYTFDRFVSDNRSVVASTYEFLNVDSSFDPNLTTSRNKSGIPKSNLLNAVLSVENPIVQWLRPILPSTVREFGLRVKNANLRSMPDLTTGERKELLALYGEDIETLNGLIEDDVSAWLSNEIEK